MSSKRLGKRLLEPKPKPKICKIREVKREIRILGFSGAVVDGVLCAIGIVMRGGTSLDGLIKVDLEGEKSTETLANAIAESSHYEQLRVVLLEGRLCSEAAIDYRELSSSLKLPVVVLSAEKMPSWGGSYGIGLERRYFLYVTGISLAKAKEILELSTRREGVPEPIRASNVILGGLKRKSLRETAMIRTRNEILP